ncbi:Uncharacterised protein r2_g542 [Pycnogonum litorale]
MPDPVEVEADLVRLRNRRTGYKSWIQICINNLNDLNELDPIPMDQFKAQFDVFIQRIESFRNVQSSIEELLTDEQHIITEVSTQAAYDNRLTITAAKFKAVLSSQKS